MKAQIHSIEDKFMAGFNAQTITSLKEYEYDKTIRCCINLNAYLLNIFKPLLPIQEVLNCY